MEDLKLLLIDRLKSKGMDPLLSHLPKRSLSSSNTNFDQRFEQAP